MEEAEAGGGGGRREGGRGSGGDSAFIQWLTTIHDEIDSTADTLKDEVNIVKVRRITPNLEILGNEARAGSGRARTVAVMGLDDAVAKAIKNLQILRINLKEESQQLFNFPVDRMEEAIQKKLCSTQANPGGASAKNGSNVVFEATECSDLQNIHILRLPSSPASPLVRGRGGTKMEHLTLSRFGVALCEEDETFGGSGSKAAAAASDIDFITESRGGNGEVEVSPPSVPVPEPVAGGSSNNARNNGPASKCQKTNEIRFDDGWHEDSLLSVISTREDKGPKDLLSPECWLLVFDQLKEPQDWLNLYRTSSLYFTELVGDKRTTSLFSQVLPNVISYLGRNFNDILGLRLVCRPWKTAVDNQLQNYDFNSVFIKCELSSAYHFPSPARISAFLNQFEAHSGNPFVGRYACLSYNYYKMSTDVIAEYHLLATRLLDKFGTQLKSLRVDVHESSSYDIAASRLERCLQGVPNLGFLRVFCCNYVRRHHQGRRGPRPPIGGSPKEHQHQLLPLLPNLKSILFSIAGHVHRGGLSDLQNTVVGVGLCCNPTSSLERVVTIGFPSALHNFSTLKSADVSVYAAEDCSNLPNPPWPLLSKLTLSNHFDGNLGPLFKCAEHFKATLTSLRFMWPLITQDNNDSLINLKLDLPHLTTLTIEAYPSMSLELVTNLANLEVLSIHHNSSFPKNRETELEPFIESVQAEVVRWELWGEERLPKLTQICLFGAIQKKTSWDRIRLRPLRHVATRCSREFKPQRKENQRF